MATLRYDPSVGHERFQYNQREVAKMRERARQQLVKLRARQAEQAAAAGLTLDEYLDPFRTLKR